MRHPLTTSAAASLCHEAWDLMGGLIRTAWEMGVSFPAYQVAVETVGAVILDEEQTTHGHRLHDLCAWSDGMGRTATDAQRVCLEAWRRLRGLEVVREAVA